MSKNIRKFNISYRKGDVLLSEQPFAYVLKSKLHSQRCDYCFERNQLMKCSACSFAHYCDKICQKNGWFVHKYECSCIKKVAPRIVPDAARMLARLVIKLNKGGGSEKSYYSNSKYRMFKDLMSHYNEIKKDEKRIQHFTSLYAVLREYLDHQLLPNPAELLAMYGKMVVNTFNILDSEMQSIGTGLYLAASIIDHSCLPNAVAVFEGTRIFIRTLQDLQSLDWMKVCISYVELLNLPSVRKKDLEETYYFLCQCKRCSDIQELNWMTSTICQNNNCQLCILGGTMKTTLSCPHCTVAISQETKNKISEVVQFTEEQLQKMGDSAYLDICRICLQNQNKLFHLMNIYKVKILDLAMESCIELKKWEEALDYGVQLIEPFLKYYGDLHPVRGIFLMKLGKIASWLDKIEEARKFFKEAVKILSITHGDRHGLVRELLTHIHQT